MLNAEWGMVNSLIFKYFQVEGPVWLLNRWSGLAAICTVHIWKYLPFWTLILLAGRLAIPKDLYESADVDGASTLQKFRFVTRSEEHTSELQSLMRISYAVFCLQ